MTDCDHVWHHAASGTPLPAAYVSHRQHCPECSRLEAAEAWMTRRTRKKIALGPALRAAIAADPGPVKARTGLQRAVPSMVVAVLAIATTSLVAPVRGDPWGLLACATLGLVVAVGIGLVFHRGADGLGPSLWARWTYVAAGIAVFGALALGSPNAHPVVSTPPMTLAAVHSRRPEISALMSQGWPGASRHDTDERRTPLGAGGCASYGMVLTLLLGTVLLSGARRTVPVSPEATGACVGLTAGLVAATALGMHSAGGSTHMVIAHGLPVVLGVMLGVTLGRRVLAP